MSEWFLINDDDALFPFNDEDINTEDGVAYFHVDENDQGNVYGFLSFKQIEDLYKRLIAEGSSNQDKTRYFDASEIDERLTPGFILTEDG